MADDMFQRQRNAQETATKLGHVITGWRSYHIEGGTTASVMSCTIPGCEDTAVERDGRVGGTIMMFHCRAVHAADDWERLPVSDPLPEDALVVSEINVPKLQDFIARVEAGESAIDILLERP